MIDQSRRGFLRGLGAFVACAPAIVSVANIMPVKAMPAASVLDEMLAGGPTAMWLPVWDGKTFQQRIFPQVYSKNPMLSLIRELQAERRANV